MLTAVAYVWPTTPLQQLRAALCMVLLGAMRLLNLAVPILYRDVVNTFRRGQPLAADITPQAYGDLAVSISAHLRAQAGFT